LRKDVFRYIEREIYDFHDTCTHLVELEDNIINRTTEKHEIRSNTVSNPTLSIATIMMTNKAIIRMNETIDAIENAFDKFSPEQRVVLQYKYWKHPFCSWESVAMKYYVDSRTVYRWRRVLVNEVANKLGLS
jgi:RinA family phage transcriptional activator